MLDDAELFVQLCQQRGILAESEVVEAVKASCSSGELKLAHTSVIASLCEVIAQVLSSSSTIKVLDLSDCMLISKGLSPILKAVSEGSSVSSLYLKGNNISGPLVEQLGDMLLHNNTIKVMHVDWNNLGSQVDAFAKFCDGLAKNNCIEELDLKYNQISTLCADSLVRVFKSNRNLKNLDLAWNSLGMSGGQKILQGIKHNRTLLSLNLKGNCVPNEIYSAIKEQIMENQKRRVLSETPFILKENIHPILITSEEDDQMNYVKSRLQKKKKKREMRDSPLGDSGNEDADIDARRLMLKKINGESCTEFTEKIEALNQILKDRLATIDNLHTEVEAKNMELKHITTENEELKTEIKKMQEEYNNTLEEKNNELENLKKTMSKTENNWKESYKELEEAYQNNLKVKQEFESKNRAYEKELRKASIEVQSMKEKFSSTIQNYEDTISEYKMEVHRVKREMQEKENRCKVETNTLKESLKESTEALEKCQEQLQKIRNELRESLESQAKLKIKADEAERFASRTAKIEETLHKSKEEREKLEEKLHESRKSVASLQKQVIRVQEEAMEPQKRYEALKLELQIEREKSISLKAEMHDERKRMKEQNEQIQKLLSQINGLYAQLSEVQSNHAEALRIKESEIEKLKNVISQKTRELDEYKSEQVQRAHQFQAAVSKYLGTFGSNPAIS